MRMRLGRVRMVLVVRDVLRSWAVLGLTTCHPARCSVKVSDRLQGDTNASFETYSPGACHPSLRPDAFARSAGPEPVGRCDWMGDSQRHSGADQGAGIPIRDFVITDFGAKPDTESTDAIRKAVEACHAAGGAG